MPTLRLIASARLTAACLAAALTLVVLGTLRQHEIGLLGIQREYFHSVFVTWRLPDSGILIAYFPGGYLIGAVLILNLCAASAMQFITRNIRPGLILINLGATLMALSEFMSSAGRIEGNLTLVSGQPVEFAENWRASELAITVRKSNSESDKVVAVPETHLQRLQQTSGYGLPFTVSVSRYLNHAEIKTRKGQPPPGALSANDGFGADRYAEPKIASGRLSERRHGAAELTVFANRDDSVLGNWLVATDFPPQAFTYEGVQYAVQLRPERHPLPFAVRFISEIDSVSILLGIESGQSDGAAETTIKRGTPIPVGDWSLHLADPPERHGPKVILAAKTPGRDLPYFACVLLLAGFATHAGAPLAARYLKRKEAA